MEIVKIGIAKKMVDLKAILPISFEQKYLERLEGFKLIAFFYFFVWKKYPLNWLFWSSDISFDIG